MPAHQELCTYHLKIKPLFFLAGLREIDEWPARGKSRKFAFPNFRNFSNSPSDVGLSLPIAIVII